MFRILVALLVSAPAVAFAQGGASRVFTIDDIFEYNAVEDPQLSPDGLRVVYVVNRRDLKENVQNTDLWMVDTAGGAPVRLTHHVKADRSPRWSPDGRRVAFISNRGGKNQIWLLDVKGGEPFVLTSQKDGVETFAWSPDGRRIAFTGVEPRPEELEKQITDRWLPRVVDQDYRYTALWVADVESKETRQVTKGKQHVGGFDWAPDSRRLVYSAAISPYLPDGDTSDIFVVDAAGVEPRKLAGFAGSDTGPQWSLDGKFVLFSSRGDGKSSAANANFHVVAAGGGEPRNVTKAFDESPSFEGWSPDGTIVYFSSTQRTERHLFALTLAADATGLAAINRVTPDGAVYGGFSVDRQARRIAFLRETGSDAPDVHVGDLGVRLSAVRKLTDHNPQLKMIALGAQEVLRWKNSSGQEVEGILVKPVGYAEGRRYPLLSVIHGGPSGTDVNGFSYSKSAYPVQVFAGRGYAILMVNYRGSTGYGEAWRKGNVGSLGAHEFDDINTGIDALIARGLADADRLGFMGWSYGGHMTYWAVTHSDRFKAASSGAGATNLISMYAQTDIPHFYTRTYFGLAPWDDFDFYVKHSSFFQVAKVKTPTLIQYGEKDARVPMPQGLEFYRALKERGVPTELVIYPDQPHGVQEPRYQKDLLQRNLDWFERWIGAKRPTTS